MKNARERAEAWARKPDLGAVPFVADLKLGQLIAYYAFLAGYSAAVKDARAIAANRAEAFREAAKRHDDLHARSALYNQKIAALRVADEIAALDQEGGEG